MAIHMTVEAPTGTEYSSTTPATVGEEAPKMREAAPKVTSGMIACTRQSTSAMSPGLCSACLIDLMSLPSEF